MILIFGILQFLGPGMPPPYKPVYDLNGDGVITITDLLNALAAL